MGSSSLIWSLLTATPHMGHMGELNQAPRSGRAKHQGRGGHFWCEQEAKSKSKVQVMGLLNAWESANPGPILPESQLLLCASRSLVILQACSLQVALVSIKETQLFNMCMS